MKAIKALIKTVAALLVIVLPLSLILSLAVMTPDMYDKSFMGQLDEKFDRLYEIDEPKLVVVGGSSVAFGLDSALLEQYTGMPVVNFGLYAALGTRLMLDLSRDAIGEGDVVVISPELDAQTMSMYFNSESTLQAMDGSYYMLSHVDRDNIFSLLGAMFAHLGRKIALKEPVDPQGVYNSSSFNEYGDIIYDRPSNVMESYYDTNKTVTLDESILDEEFIDYLNEYASHCKAQGARVYFSFCPMNIMGMTEGTDARSLYDFECLLRRRLDFDLISYADDYIMDAGYFYDSNFHLNNTGARYRTLLLARDVLLAEGIPTLIAEELPDAPELGSGAITVLGYDQNQEYFTFQRMESGNYRITGLTDKGKAAVELTIPRSYTEAGARYGVAVTSVGLGAFKGCSATLVNIPADSYVNKIENGAFIGASKIRTLNIYIDDPNAIKPPSTGEGGFTGINSLRIHVPRGSDYRIDYFWSEVPKNVQIIEDLD
jgi:hypothetical protein